MTGVHSKDKSKKKIYSPWAFFAVIFVAFLLGHAAFGAYEKRNVSLETRQAMEQEAKELEERKIALEKEIERLRSSDGIEREIREKFQVVKPGEEMIVVKTSE